MGFHACLVVGFLLRSLSLKLLVQSSSASDVKRIHKPVFYAHFLLAHIKKKHEFKYRKWKTAKREM